MRALARSIFVMEILAVSLSFASFSFGAASSRAASHLFEANCSQCHGPEGKGKPGHTPNFTSARWQARHSNQRIVAAITNGVKGTMMPPWKGKLTTTQIRSLARFIRSLNTANSSHM
jgi:cytochrome c oxidase cbb3-type subunit III